MEEGMDKDYLSNYKAYLTIHKPYTSSWDLKWDTEKLPSIIFEGRPSQQSRKVLGDCSLPTYLILWFGVRAFLAKEFQSSVTGKENRTWRVSPNSFFFFNMKRGFSISIFHWMAAKHFLTISIVQKEVLNKLWIRMAGTSKFL